MDCHFFKLTNQVTNNHTAAAAETAAVGSGGGLGGWARGRVFRCGVQQRCEGGGEADG